MTHGPSSTRVRFGRFALSPSRRQLLADGVEVRLIPRYFDLLVLLVARRHEAVHRQEIFDRVWADVIVSDGALSQAIRTLRRTLGDDPREPVFIRTVSRHGYQFVYPDVREEPEDAARAPDPGPVTAPAAEAPSDDPPAAPLGLRASREVLVERLLGHENGRPATVEERRDAAEQLHALGTADAIRAIAGRPGEADALAILRDTRWDVPGAADVPLLTSAHAAAAVMALVRLRLRRAARLIARRWVSASTGGAAAGVVAGMAGGLLLFIVPDSDATPDIFVSLGLVGAVAGALGAAGVGAGLAGAEALARSQRRLALVACGAAGGAFVGTLAHLMARSILAGVFGHDDPALGGTLEGLVLGASAGLGYGHGTIASGEGMPTPHGRSRVRAALLTGAACAVAGLALAAAGGHLVAASLDDMARHFAGASVGLAPLARLLGEQDLRPLTRTLVSGFEGLLFGAGVAFGLTRRPSIGD